MVLKWQRKVRRTNEQPRAFLLTVRAVPDKLVLLFLVVIFGPNLWSQIPSTVASRIQGTVRDGETGAPIESAILRLEQSPDSSAIDETITDRDGRFAFADVMSGEYRIRAEKVGYLGAIFGNSANQKVSVPVKQPEPVDLVLIRSSVMTGRVFNALGQRASGVQVVALSRRTSHSGINLKPEGEPAQVDHLGEFRLYGLAPGFYSLAVIPSGEPNALAFPPLYFPGFSEAKRADFIELHPGETHSDIEMFLPAPQAQELNGTVTGIPSNWVDHAVAVSLLPIDGMSMVMQSVMADKNGNFRLPAVPHGSYRVFAYGPVVARGPGGPVAGEDSRQGVASIEVTGGAFENLTIALLKRVAVEVAVLFEPTSKTNRACYADAEADLWSADPMPIQDAFFRARVTKQATIFHPVPQGRYSVKLSGLESPCFVQQVTFGEQRGPVIRLNENGRLVFTLSTHVGSVTGTVAGEDGSITAHAHVILIPSDESPEVSASQIRTTKSDAKGSFRLDQIPPGYYRLLAVMNPVSNVYLDPLFWSKHKVLEISVKPDATINSELRIVK